MSAIDLQWVVKMLLPKIPLQDSHRFGAETVLDQGDDKHVAILRTRAADFGRRKTSDRVGRYAPMTGFGIWASFTSPNSDDQDDFGKLSNSRPPAVS